MSYFGSFSSMTDDEVSKWLIENGITKFRKLKDGEWICLYKLMFTMSVCCGVDMGSMYKYRWCFADHKEAEKFFNECENYDDIPSSRKSLKGHRYLDKPRIVEYDEKGYPRW